MHTHSETQRSHSHVVDVFKAGTGHHYSLLAAESPGRSLDATAAADNPDCSLEPPTLYRRWIGLTRRTLTHDGGLVQKLASRPAYCAAVPHDADPCIWRRK